MQPYEALHLAAESIWDHLEGKLETDEANAACILLMTHLDSAHEILRDSEHITDEVRELVNQELAKASDEELRRLEKELAETRNERDCK